MPNLLQIRVRWLSWSHMVEIPFPKAHSKSQSPLHLILAKSKFKALMKVRTVKPLMPKYFYSMKELFTTSAINFKLSNAY